jgi:hypothetical protein
MAVIAIFKFQIKPGRLPDFKKKLAEAADPKFASPTMAKSVRLFRSTVPGPDTGVVLMLEYEDMAWRPHRIRDRQRGMAAPVRAGPQRAGDAGLGGTADGSAGDLGEADATERVPFGFQPR